jgi:hypothetical protein
MGLPSVVAKWLGHSPEVAAQHYLMSRDHYFEDVVGSESSPSAGADGESRSWQNVVGILFDASVGAAMLAARA